MGSPSHARADRRARPRRDVEQHDGMAAVFDDKDEPQRALQANRPFATVAMVELSGGCNPQ